MELWDVYDINRKFTGKVIDRHSNERLKKGEYHLVVEAIIINLKGEGTKLSPFLLFIFFFKQELLVIL